MGLERYFHGLWSAGWLDLVASATAQYGLFVCVAFFAIAWFRRRPRGALLPFAAGGAIAIALDVVAGLLYHDVRPFVVLGFAPLVSHGIDNGFPSDHSAAATFVGVATLFVDAPLGVATCVIAIALGVARLYCLLHSPVDVLVGWTIGALPALAAGVWWKRSRSS